MEDTPRSDRGARSGVRVRLPPWILTYRVEQAERGPMERFAADNRATKVRFLPLRYIEGSSLRCQELSSVASEGA